MERKIRFIAIQDNVDSAKGSSGLTVPVINVMNDYYARSISEKTKAAKQTRAKQGMYLGSKAPYGYQKDPKDPHNLTHTLTHNSLDPSGQGITKEHLSASKSKNSEISKLFSNHLGQQFVSTKWDPRSEIDCPRKQTKCCSRGQFVFLKGFNLFTCFISCRIPVSYHTDWR